MPHSIEYRIMENGPGWYWEVIDGNEVVARGIASSQKDACAQAAEAARKAEAPAATGIGCWLAASSKTSTGARIVARIISVVRKAVSSAD
jgi:ABC-type protease/lipase transport system fused ATPase/permease subunit